MLVSRTIDPSGRLLDTNVILEHTNGRKQTGTRVDQICDIVATD
jgi:hypothetical protein